jgi:hypothetical protein
LFGCRSLLIAIGLAGMPALYALAEPVDTTTSTSTTSTSSSISNSSSSSNLAYGAITVPGGAAVSFVAMQNPLVESVTAALALPNLDPHLAANLALLQKSPTSTSSIWDAAVYSNNAAFSDGTLTVISGDVTNAQTILNAAIAARVLGIGQSSTSAVDAAPLASGASFSTVTEQTSQQVTQQVTTTIQQIQVGDIILGYNTNINTNTNTNTNSNTNTEGVTLQNLDFEAGPGGVNSAGALAQLASGGGWQTSFTLVNLGGSSSPTELNLFDDNGAALPVSFSAPGTVSTITGNLAAGATQSLATDGLGAAPATGWAQLLVPANVGGFGVFRTDAGQEAAVPLETRNASAFYLAFDNTNGYVNGVAVANNSTQAANITLDIPDAVAGAVVVHDTIALPALGHTSFVLTDRYPKTAGSTGMARFMTPPNGQISVVGIRYGASGAFTTIPALVNGATSSGSMAHFASGGGWKTTFTVVNTGTASAPAQLNFFDDNGNPAVIPLSLPQTSQTLSPASSYSATLNPGTVLILESAGSSSQAALSGSAELRAAAGVSAFAVFESVSNSQEAAVPLETRTATTYVLAYDNSNGYINGVAIANASNQSATITVTLRNASGTVTGSGSIPLAAQGHTAFLLADEYPGTAGVAGTLAFTTQPGVPISVLGLRFSPTGAFTSVPALASE